MYYVLRTFKLSWLASSQFCKLFRSWLTSRWRRAVDLWEFKKEWKKERKNERMKERKKQRKKETERKKERKKLKERKKERNWTKKEEENLRGKSWSQKNFFINF